MTAYLLRPETLSATQVQRLRNVGVGPPLDHELAVLDLASAPVAEVVERVRWVVAYAEFLCEIMRREGKIINSNIYSYERCI